jgi:hypothetical protein
MVYHISFWLLPPLGPLPRHPPPPVFSVSFSATPDEVYLVGFDKGVFRYEVYSRSSRAHLEHDHASWFIEGGEYVRDRDSGHDRWVLRLRIRGA